MVEENANAARRKSDHKLFAYRFRKNCPSIIKMHCCYQIRSLGRFRARLFLSRHMTEVLKEIKNVFLFTSRQRPGNTAKSGEVLRLGQKHT